MFRRMMRCLKLDESTMFRLAVELREVAEQVFHFFRAIGATHSNMNVTVTRIQFRFHFRSHSSVYNRGRPCLLVGTASSSIGQTQDFRPLFSQTSIDLDEMWQRSVVARSTVVGSISPQSVPWRRQAKRKDCFSFVIPKMYHNSSCIQRNWRCRSG